ncbi:hypothetical protein GCM10010193_70630 [Kitasatospora atroaurantiaca]|uniref:Uncharacterized protein n=1 Tax=Kitasatospora atroaurantiaca TaxID=285545 RepID=A0A561ENL0_9ACTN|nr:hypothetical protein [Kitasatospora atroaurantiaca]TWE17149.1 hypothetical protein FB465_2154 [Kitasatospora atroaurantiaca]
MSTTTTRLGLYKTASDGSELVNVVTDLLNNLDALDLAAGSQVVTSSTRPSSPFSGKHILESDTSYRSYFHNGTAPASGGWVEYPNNSGTYGGQVWASRATNATTLRVANTFGGGNTAASVLTEHAAAAGVAYGARVSGDSQDRIQIRADGRIDLGPGSGARDTSWYRSAAGEITSDGAFRLPSTTDVSLSSTGHAFQIGPSSGLNVRMDNNEIQAVNNGAASILLLQADSGPASFFGNAASPTTYTLTVNGNLTVNGVGQVLFARKTADESVTSSTTLQDDNHLTVAVAANAVYEFELMLMAQTANSDVAGDIKVGFTFPSAATLHFTGTGPNNADLSGATSSNSNGEWIARNGATSGSTTIPYGMSGIAIGVLLKGLLITGANAGNLQLQWAQNASDPDALTMLTGSWMRADRVA